MAKATPRKGMQLFDANEELIGMITGARGGTIVVGGQHIPKAAIARVTQNRAYLKPAFTAGAAPPTGHAPRPRRPRPVSPASPPIVPLSPQAEARLIARAAIEEADVREPERAAPATTVVPLAAERLRATTRQAELGEVRVHKTVVAEQARVPVDLTHEEVHVEERFVGERPARSGEALFEERTVRIPVHGEEAFVTKEAVVTGEVVIHKDLATERRYVADTVRAERAEVVTRDPAWDETR